MNSETCTAAAIEIETAVAAAAAPAPAPVSRWQTPAKAETETNEPTPAEALREAPRTPRRQPLRNETEPIEEAPHTPRRLTQAVSPNAPRRPSPLRNVETARAETARPGTPMPQRRAAPPSAANFNPTTDPRAAAALKAKQRHLMESFCDMLYYRIEDAKTQSKAYACFGTFRLPTPDNRERDVNSCYWAGKGDIRTEGTPIVQLLQGVRDHKTGEVHPEWLWGGQTAIDNMNDVFGADGWLIYNHFDAERKEFSLYLVDRAQMRVWEQKLDELRARRPRREFQPRQPQRYSAPTGARK